MFASLAAPRRFFAPTNVAGVGLQAPAHLGAYEQEAALHRQLATDAFAPDPWAQEAARQRRLGGANLFAATEADTAFAAAHVRAARGRAARETIRSEFWYPNAYSSTGCLAAVALAFKAPDWCNLPHAVAALLIGVCFGAFCTQEVLAHDVQPAFTALGEQRLAAGDFAGAEAALLRSPHHPRALLGLAEVRRQQGNWQGATTALDRLQELGPLSAPAAALLRKQRRLTASRILSPQPWLQAARTR